ncbi:hypothetical protein PPACK8108_LOCUS12451 [Phakopsora pachyrhizi]|uniref:Uncharacterized protein n=1 Tax=Phakopsora pachyrhizi TaxID=170000 RepID=A0AAV0B6R7_PHAPC|nr:hypothetical protein PPACK8108_LOCUS12451 [Phakopsora pachyrhizi]
MTIPGGDLWSEDYPGVSKWMPVEYEYLKVYPAVNSESKISENTEDRDLIRNQTKEISLGDQNNTALNNVWMVLMHNDTADVTTGQLGQQLNSSNTVTKFCWSKGNKSCQSHNREGTKTAKHPPQKQLEKDKLIPRSADSTRSLSVIGRDQEPPQEKGEGSSSGQLSMRRMALDNMKPIGKEDETTGEVKDEDRIRKGFKVLEQDKDNTRIKEQKSRGYRIKRKRSRVVEQRIVDLKINNNNNNKKKDSKNNKKKKKKSNKK